MSCFIVVAVFLFGLTCLLLYYDVAIACINLACLVLLFPLVYRVRRDFEQQKKQGLDSAFDPKSLGIDGADFWEASFESPRAASRNPALTYGRSERRIFAEVSATSHVL